MSDEKRKWVNYAHTYIETDGTFYHEKTPEKVIQVLNRFMHDREVRLKLYYGDPETGVDWGESYDILGYIGRSTGDIKIPILVYNNKCYGGVSILDHCIVKIEHANKRKGGVLYQHENYHRIPKICLKCGHLNNPHFNKGGGC